MNQKHESQPFSFYLSPQEQKALIHRINRMVGQLEAIKRQIQSGQCADDLLIQVSAVRGALTQFTIRILENHLLECARTCMRQDTPDNEAVLQRITRALSVILKQGV